MIRGIIVSLAAEVNYGL